MSHPRDTPPPPPPPARPPPGGRAFLQNELPPPSWPAVPSAPMGADSAPVWAHAAPSGAQAAPQRTPQARVPRRAATARATAARGPVGGAPAPLPPATAPKSPDSGPFPSILVQIGPTWSKLGPFGPRAPERRPGRNLGPSPQNMSSLTIPPAIPVPCRRRRGGAAAAAPPRGRRLLHHSPLITPGVGAAARRPPGRRGPRPMHAPCPLTPQSQIGDPAPAGHPKSARGAGGAARPQAQPGGLGRRPSAVRRPPVVSPHGVSRLEGKSAPNLGHRALRGGPPAARNARAVGRGSTALPRAPLGPRAVPNPNSQIGEPAPAGHPKSKIGKWGRRRGPAPGGLYCAA